MAKTQTAFSPVKIANSRIGRVLAALPEEVTEGKPSNTRRFAGVFSRIRPAVLVLLCSSAFVWGGVQIYHDTGLLKPPQLFDPARVVIKPGLYVRCKLCQKDLYNETGSQHACWTVTSGEPFCLACHAPGGLQLLALCPKCGCSYAPELTVRQAQVKSADGFETRFDCLLRAVCPKCAHVMVSNETVTFYGE